MQFGTPNPATLWDAQSLSRDRLSLDIDFTDLISQLHDECETLALGRAEAGLAALLSELVSGRGLAIVHGFPVHELSLAKLERLFWRVGEFLGTAESQSVMGERLGHVVSVVDDDPHARAYRRNERLTPHSDPADLLGFLCIQPATTGGESLFASSMVIHERLRAENPEVLELLYRGFYYHRFGEQGDDDDPITPYRVPVFADQDGYLSANYVRQYIEIAAHEDPDRCALTEADRRALDRFEELALEPGLGFRFTLEAGEAVFANNYTALHAREAFSDPPGAAKRHLLRLWLSTNPPRRVPIEMQIYSGSAGIPPQPGRTPSYQTEIDTQ